MSYNDSTADECAKVIAAQEKRYEDGGYRNTVGPPIHYDVGGAEQLSVLYRLGLRETHTLLDIGCGPLRCGRLLIVYLLPGNYCGLEPVSQLYKSALASEIGEQLAERKRPQFSDDENFTLTTFGRTFDWLLCHSIFSHATQRQVFRCLDQAAQVTHTGSKMLLTYCPGKKNYDGHEMRTKVAFRPDWMKEQASRFGFDMQDLKYPHLTGQRWVLLEKRECPSKSS